MIKVPSSGPKNAKIFIVGEAPGVDEEKEGKPFVGASGQELGRMLNEAGILRSDCFITNVCKYRPPGNKIKHFFYTNEEAKDLKLEKFRGCFPKEQILEGLSELRKEILEVNPNIIVALGNVAMWALADFEDINADKGMRLPKGITVWRGSMLESRLNRESNDTPGEPFSRDKPADPHPSITISRSSITRDDNASQGKLNTHSAGYKFLPTIHPAAIMRQWDKRSDVVHDLRRVLRDSEFPEIKYPEYNFIVRPTFMQVMSVLNTLLQKVKEAPTLIANDIETRSGYIACIGLAWSRLDAICIPLMDINSKDSNYWSFEEEFQITLKLRELLLHKNCHNVGQNFLFDCQYFAHHYGYVPNTTRDTMIMHHTCFPGSKRSLDYISSMYCQFYQYWKAEGKEWNPKEHSEEQLWVYNCKDCINTWESCTVLEKVIDKVKLREQFEFQMSLFYPLLRIMLRGVKINIKERGSMGLELMEAMAYRQQYFEDILGHPLNPGSPKKMAQLFYDDFKLPVQKSRTTWRPTCDKDALTKLKAKEPLVAPLIDRIEEWRSCAVFLRTFVRAGLEPNNRLSCMFDPTGTETFRFASKKNAFWRGTNLQNIPKGDEENEEDDEFSLPQIRRMFIPDSGMALMDWDLEKADAQVVAWEANDEGLKQIFREGYNLHEENAKELFGKVTKHNYAMAKRGVHATNYDISARALAVSLGITIHEAERFQKLWFGAHPGIKDWQERILEQLMTTRSVTNKFGYRRFYFDRIQGLLKEALAWIPQSTVACVINRGLKNIDTNLPEVQLLIQVHDSLVMQVPISKLDKLIPKIKEQLLISVSYDDPLIIGVNGQIGRPSWGELEKIKEAS